MKLRLWIALAAVAFVGILLYSTLEARQHRVEVCMTFQGRSKCSIAAGRTQEQALRTAVENACGVISSGMTDSLACSGTQPSSIRWLED